MEWSLYIIIAVVLLAFELIYFKIADSYNIVDKPNERSSHTHVVLRGGGIVYVVGMLLYAVFFGIELWPFLLGITLVAGVSFVDDIRSLSDGVRLGFQFVAILLMFLGWGIFNLENLWVLPLVAILCVGIINAYNFMDGINGINGGYTFATLIPLALTNLKMDFVDQRLIIVALLANFMFCIFNFRPKGKAVCFAGDVGSVGSAFIVIFVLGRLILSTMDFSYIVFLIVYGVDVVLTISHRIMLHENLGTAHRKHVYQLLANELNKEHTSVALFYSVLQLAISLGMILIPNSGVWHWGYLLFVCVVLSLAYLLFKRKYYHLHVEYLNGLHGEKKE